MINMNNVSKPLKSAGGAETFFCGTCSSVEFHKLYDVCQLFVREVVNTLMTGAD